MRVFGYSRVSTNTQADLGNSLDTQISQIRSYALSKGLKLDEEGIYVERGISGATPFRNRPEGSRLWEQLSKGDTLILAKLDRGFRNSADAITTLQDLKDRGVSVHCLDIGEVTGSGLGGVFFTLLSAFASFERERIASRISEVKQHRKAAGYYVGGVRGFGFDVVDGRSIPNELEMKVIKKMKLMRKNGVTIKKINEWLNTEIKINLSYSTTRSVLIRN